MKSSRLGSSSSQSSGRDWFVASEAGDKGVDGPLDCDGDDDDKVEAAVGWGFVGGVDLLSSFSVDGLSELASAAWEANRRRLQ